MNSGKCGRGRRPPGGCWAGLEEIALRSPVFWGGWLCPCSLGRRLRPASGRGIWNWLFQSLFCWKECCNNLPPSGLGVLSVIGILVLLEVALQHINSPSFVIRISFGASPGAGRGLARPPSPVLGINPCFGQSDCSSTGYTPTPPADRSLIAAPPRAARGCGTDSRGLGK